MFAGPILEFKGSVRYFKKGTLHVDLILQNRKEFMVCTPLWCTALFTFSHFRLEILKIPDNNRCYFFHADITSAEKSLNKFFKSLPTMVEWRRKS